MKYLKKYDSFINEGMFDNGIRRAHTKEIRTEDLSELNFIIRQLKDDDFVDLHLPSGNLWCKYNFGSRSLEVPGLYLTTDRIYKLNDSLQNTNYKIATKEDFYELLNDRTGDYQILNRKIGDFWNIVISHKRVDIDVCLPNFSISNGKNSVCLNKPDKSEQLRYGSFIPSYDHTGFVKITPDDVTDKFYIQNSEYHQHTNNGFQVRIIKIKK